jgi:hypothetical protein
MAQSVRVLKNARVFQSLCQKLPTLADSGSRPRPAPICAPSLHPKFCSSFTLKRNDMKTLLFNKNDAEHQDPSHKSMESEEDLIKWQSLYLLGLETTHLSQSAKYHQTDNTSVLGEQEHRRNNEADYDDLLWIRLRLQTLRNERNHFCNTNINCFLLLIILTSNNGQLCN